MSRRPWRIAILFGALLLLAACHHSGNHGHSEHGADHGDHGSELQLKLDDGRKWRVDEHTRTSAARITRLVDSSTAIHSVEEARNLAMKLDEELDVLVKGCTMTGVAHDQLHVFLMALLPKVEELKEEAEVEDLQRIRDEVGSLLEAYEQHFE